MPDRINIEKHILEKMYIEQGLSTVEIGNILNCSKSCVVSNLHRNNIEIKSRIINLKGQKFGSLTVVEMCDERRNKRACWKCLCDCGNYSIHQSDVLMLRNATKCKLCRRKQYTGEISGRYFCRIRISAKQRNLEFSITKEYIWNLFLKQNRKCVLTGIKIGFPYEFKDIYTASLDRIDSNKGYIEGNVQWVHKIVNRIKQNVPEILFIKLCRKIYLKNKYRINNTKISKKDIESYSDKRKKIQKYDK